MFNLIRTSVRLRIVDAIISSRYSVDNKSGNSKFNFYYLNDKIFSKEASSIVKKRRYRNGNR